MSEHRDPVVVEHSGTGAVAAVAIVVLVILALVAFLAFTNVDVFRGTSPGTGDGEGDLPVPTIQPPAITVPAPSSQLSPPSRYS